MENERDIDDVFFDIVESKVRFEFKEEINARKHFTVRGKDNGAIINLIPFDKNRLERSLHNFLALLHQESSKLSFEALESELEHIREKLNQKNKDE